jgi:hypothetical protein
MTPSPGWFVGWWRRWIPLFRSPTKTGPFVNWGLVDDDCRLPSKLHFWWKHREFREHIRNKKRSLTALHPWWGFNFLLPSKPLPRQPKQTTMFSRKWAVPCGMFEDFVRRIS